MASYDNQMMEQIWFSDLETETFTKALHTSFAAGDFSESLFSHPNTTPVQTPTISGISENDSLVSKKRRTAPPTGRVAKRKSRASKRAATTTFIAVDPDDFMRMVQQVTGFNDHLQLPMTAAPADGGLPTLDTSAFTVAADGGAGASHHYLDSFCTFPTLESWKAVE